MKYHRMIDDIYSVNHKHLGNIIDDTGAVNADLLTCSRRFFTNHALSVENNSVPDFDFSLAAFDVPVLSGRFAERFRQVANDDVQLIPVRINESCDYFVLNILSQVDCLDESRAIFTKWSITDGRPDKVGQYRMVADIKIVESRLSGTEVCRIAGWDVPIIVSDNIAEWAVINNMKGPLFEPIGS